MKVATIGAQIVAGGRDSKGEWSVTINVREADRKIAAALAVIESEFRIEFWDGEKLDVVRADFSGDVRSYGLDKFGDWHIKIGVSKCAAVQAALLSTMADKIFSVSFTPIEEKASGEDVETDMGSLDLGE